MLSRGNNINISANVNSRLKLGFDLSKLNAAVLKQMLIDWLIYCRAEVGFDEAKKQRCAYHEQVAAR